MYIHLMMQKDILVNKTVFFIKKGEETMKYTIESTENGCIELWKECDFKKTGKHIDIEDILNAIRG